MVAVASSGFPRMVNSSLRLLGGGGVGVGGCCCCCAGGGGGVDTDSLLPVSELVRLLTGVDRSGVLGDAVVVVAADDDEGDAAVEVEVEVDVEVVVEVGDAA
jgi:hypothetical protein